MHATLRAELESRGLQFFKVRNEDFRDRLISAGFHQEWQKRYGDEAWSLLEAAAGKLG